MDLRSIGSAPETTGGWAGVVGALVGLLTASILGGIISYLLEGRLHRGRARGHGSTPSIVAGWACAGISAASMVASTVLRGLGRRFDALLVEQWASSYVVASALARTLHHRTLSSSLWPVVVSWALTAASVGSILSSVMLYTRHAGDDSLLVGQWTPTLQGAALLVRLLGR